MKLFISWSGEFSQRVAEKLKIWIPTIIQSVEVFYSPEDIAKGENWSNRLSEELDNCSFGIVCLTPENVAAPWIHFEAGALSKSLNAQVSAIMLNISPSDVRGPIAHFQNTAFERNDFFRLFQSINKASDTPLKPEILRNAFNNAWDNLKAEIEDIIKLYPASKAETTVEDHNTSDSDALQEILRLVRKMDCQKAIDNAKSTQFPGASHHMVDAAIFPRNADPEDVFALIYKYLPISKHTEARSQLSDGHLCECVVPESDVKELSSRLDKIGAVGYFLNSK